MRTIRLKGTPRCQAQLAEHPHSPYCGKHAEWSTTDLSPDGSTTWLCEEHTRRAMQEAS
jgi:hypothetical protein